MTLARLVDLRVAVCIAGLLAIEPGCLVATTVFGEPLEDDGAYTGADADEATGADEPGTDGTGADSGWPSSGDGDEGDGDGGDGDGDEPGPDLPPPDLPPCCVDTEVSFTEVAVEAGIDHSHGVGFTAPGDCLIDTLFPPKEGFFCSIDWSAGGAAAADVDGDGWVDLYVTRVSERGILYRNLGDGTFADVTLAAGLGGLDHGNGAAFADVDEDGDLDLYVTTISDLRHHLMINHDGWFIDEAKARGASLESGHPQTGTTAAFGDYDNDGWLDLYVGDWHSDVIGDQASHARLLRGLGDQAPGHFEDVTDLVGVNVDDVHLQSETPTVGTFVLSAGWADIDGDGWVELLLASDHGCSRLFWNESAGGGLGSFLDTTHASGVGTDESGMGSAVADVDGDGDLDWFVTSITGDYSSGNRLYAYTGDRNFDDHTDAVGVRDSQWGWGAVFFDQDNDADLDLATTNGWRADTYLLDEMVSWTNEGGVMSENPAELGLVDNGQGRALLSFDYDRDGDLDLFMVNMGGAPKLFRNDTISSNRWLRVKLRGTTSNRDSLGARLELVAGGQTQVREYGGNSHFLGHSERIEHFGLGPADLVDSLVVRWPASGAEFTLEDIVPNQVIELVEPL